MTDDDMVIMQPGLDFDVQDTLAQLHFKELSLAELGLWFKLTLLMAQYGPRQSFDLSMEHTPRLARLVGSHPKTVDRLMVRLEEAGYIAYGGGILQDASNCVLKVDRA